MPPPLPVEAWLEDRGMFGLDSVGLHNQCRWCQGSHNSHCLHMLTWMVGIAVADLLAESAVSQQPVYVVSMVTCSHTTPHSRTPPPAVCTVGCQSAASAGTAVAAVAGWADPVVPSSSADQLSAAGGGPAYAACTALSGS